MNLSNTDTVNMGVRNEPSKPQELHAYKDSEPTHMSSPELGKERNLAPKGIEREQSKLTQN